MRETTGEPTTASSAATTSSPISTATGERTWPASGRSPPGHRRRRSRAARRASRRGLGPGPRGRRLRRRWAARPRRHDQRRADEPVAAEGQRRRHVPAHAGDPRRHAGGRRLRRRRRRLQRRRDPGPRGGDRPQRKQDGGPDRQRRRELPGAAHPHGSHAQHPGADRGRGLQRRRLPGPRAPPGRRSRGAPATAATSCGRSPAPAAATNAGPARSP